MKSLKLFAGLTAAILTAGAANAVTYDSRPSAGFGAIPDNNSTGVTRTVDVAPSLIIDAVVVQIRDLSASWIGDVMLTLTSPTGTSVELLCRVGVTACGGSSSIGDSSDLIGNYTFRDDALNNIYDVADAIAGGGVPTGAYSTANAAAAGGGLLSTFDGEDSMGTWSLTLSDNFVGDATSAGAFRLSIVGEPAAVPVPAALPMLLVGLGGFALVRRRKAA